MTAKKAQYHFLLISLLAIGSILVAAWCSLLSWPALVVAATANFLLYGLTLFLFRRTLNTFSDPNPQASIRAILSGFMIKFFVLTLAAMLYIFSMRKAVSIPALCVSAVLYILYTVAEIRALLLLLKSSDHG